MFNIEPFPTETPEHAPLYQYHPAPVPRIPPVIPRVVAEPSQITDGLDVADAGITEFVFTVNKILTQLVVLQTFSALT